MTHRVLAACITGMVRPGDRASATDPRPPTPAFIRPMLPELDARGGDQDGERAPA